MSILARLFGRRGAGGSQDPLAAAGIVVMTRNSDALRSLRIVVLHGQVRRLRARMDVPGWAVRVDEYGAVVSERKS